MPESEIAFPPAVAAGISAIDSALTLHGYRDLLALYGWNEPRHAARAFDRLLLDDPLAALAGFAEDGEAVDPDLLGVDATGVAALVEAGLLERADAGGVRLAGLRFVSHFGLLLLVQQRLPDSTAYHGEDSLALARHILDTRPGDRILDLCGGVGSQGLLAASKGADVISVDVNASLAPLQRFNRALNTVAGSITFVTGDLYDAVLDQQFDGIFANPPLVPVPPGRSIGLHSDGGASGLDLVERIVAGVPVHLAPGGRFVTQGLSFGDSGGPALDGIIQALEASGCTGLASVIYREQMPAVGPMMTTLIQTVAAASGQAEACIASEYASIATAAAADCLYSWQITARRHSGQGRMQRFNAFCRNQLLWNI